MHYYPNEIENIIHQIPGVVEVCVCGLPDIICIDLPAAMVVKSAGSNLSEENIFDHVADKMSDIKKLRGGVYFVDEIPKNSSGKYLRKTVKEMVIKLSKTKKLNYNSN